MEEYYYSQKYHAYANKKIANGYIMASHGCYITCFAMILSYFNHKAFYPEQMLKFLQRKGYILPDARVYNSGLEDAAGNELRFDYHETPKIGEHIFGIRQVYFGPINHWVLDHPIIPNKIIDTYDGKVKDYNHYSYTGQVRFFMGKFKARG